MSIRRFDIRGWDIDFVLADDGDHVLFEDHQAEVERLGKALRWLYEAAETHLDMWEFGELKSSDTGYLRGALEGARAALGEDDHE